MNELQIAIEVLRSTIKWFLLFIIANNLIWVAIHFVDTSKIDGDISQGGENNIQTQEVSYGK